MDCPLLITCTGNQLAERESQGSQTGPMMVARRWLQGSYAAGYSVKK